MDVLKYINNRQKDSEKWDEQRLIMSTHIYGSPPKELLEKRRPFESSNELILQYRLDNFQPFSKEYFNLANSEIIESADQLSFNIDNMDSSTQDFEKVHRIRVGCIDFNIKDYVVKFLGEKAQADPNGFVISLPVHPHETLYPDYREELPNFNNVTNQNIDIDIQYVSSEFIYGFNENEILFYGGEWVYNVDKDGSEISKPYYWAIDKDVTNIVVPVKQGDKIEYIPKLFYNNNLHNKEYFEHAPFHVLGHNLTLEDNFSYYESNFSGAVACFNKAMGIESDLDVSMTKFVYPREFTFYDICDANSCNYNNELGYNTVPYDNDDGCVKCSRCEGTGYIQPHTSPMGTTVLPRDTSFDAEGTFKEPYMFRQPPIDGVEFLKESTFDWMDRGIQALHVTKQNVTNASDRSKDKDLKQKISNRTKGVKNIIRIYVCILNDTQAFHKGRQNISIPLPNDYQVKSSEDITQQISESKGAPTIYTATLTTELMLKRNGNNAITRKILSYLEINDLLYGVSVDDAVKKKTNYGLTLDSRAQLINDKGFAILKMIAEENENFVEMKNDAIKVLFEIEVGKILPDQEITLE
ncbi:MAG: hypothetical protein GY756_26915 [bacterium]|nr:hypothetical protein [bacterium]